MRKIDFKEFCKGEVKLPKEGWTVLIRDEVPYQTWGVKDYFIKLGTHPWDNPEPTKIYVKDIKESDIVYQFNNVSEMIKCLNAGVCLNKFKLTLDIFSRRAVIVKLIKEGKYLGYHGTTPDKYQVKLDLNGNITFYHKGLYNGTTWVGESGPTAYGDYIYYTDKEFEFWEWMFKTS